MDSYSRVDHPLGGCDFEKNEKPPGFDEWWADMLEKAGLKEKEPKEKSTDESKETD